MLERIDALGHVPATQIADLEATLVGHARTFDPDQLRRIGAHAVAVLDPDGAVVRAGLVRHYGARHGLWQLDPDIAYLSGDELPDGLRGFEVLEQLPYAEKRLRQVAEDAGFTHFKRATETPFNLVFDVRP